MPTGRTPTFGTTFKAGWQGNNVVFAIRSDERRGEKPSSTSTRHGDQALWYGDAIEIEIATETHSYYSIAVSPAGHVADLDRGAPRGQQFGWDSKAEVATHIAEDHWTVEISLPVTQDENDPLHQIIGRKPTQSLPWHINLCRQRIREDGQEHSALSPTGIASFHVPMKFARFYDGKSHKFEADPNATDFVIGFRIAEKNRKAEAFLALAEGKITDFQKSAALEQAALRDYYQLLNFDGTPRPMSDLLGRMYLALAAAPDRRGRPPGGAGAHRPTDSLHALRRTVQRPGQRPGPARRDARLRLAAAQEHIARHHAALAVRSSQKSHHATGWSDGGETRRGYRRPGGETFASGTARSGIRPAERSV